MTTVGESWLLISIVTGSEASLRVRVWRDLRKLGAVYLHSSVCLLPDIEVVSQQVQALVARVRAGGGRARVVKIVLTDPAELAEVMADQTKERDREYQEVIERTAGFLDEITVEIRRGRATYTEVEESEADLERFDRWFTAIIARDYFTASGRAEAEQALSTCRAALADFEAMALAADTDSAGGPDPRPP